MFVGSQKRHFSSRHVNLSCVFNIDVGIVSITSAAYIEVSKCVCICFVRVDEWYTLYPVSLCLPFCRKNSCLTDIPNVNVTWCNVLLLSFYAQKVLLRISEH